MSLLRELVAKIGLDVDAQSFMKGELAAEGVKAALEKVVEAAKEVAEFFVETIKQTAEYSEEMSKLSAETGISTDQLQGLGAAAKVHGIDVQLFGKSLGFLSTQMYEASKGGKEQKQIFKDVGVSATDATGKLRPLGDMFGDIAEKFSKMADGPEKLALSRKLFSRGGGDLIELLNGGREMVEEYEKLPKLSAEQVKQGKELSESIALAREESSRLLMTGIAPLLPKINALVQRFVKWSEANKDLIQQKIELWFGRVVGVVETLVDWLGKGSRLVSSFLEKWNGWAGAPYVNLMLIIAALSTMGGLMISAGKEAVETAVRMGLAWGEAALPFMAIMAVVAALYLMFSDLNNYNESVKRGYTGHFTYFGRFKEQIEKWDAQMLADPGKQPWWLKALHEAYDVLDGIRRLMIEAHLINQDQNRSFADKVADFADPGRKYRAGAASSTGDMGALSPEARARVVRGLDFDIWKNANPETVAGMSPEALARFRRTWETSSPEEYRQISVGADLRDQYAKAYAPSVPMLSPAGPYAGGLVAQGGDTYIQMDVHPSPGMNEELLAHKIVHVVNTKIRPITQAHIDAAHPSS